MDLKQIRTDRASASVVYMGETLNFKYRPAMVTPRTYHKLQGSEDIEELGKFFSELLVWWDMTQGGDEVEIIDENLVELPLGLLREMAKEVVNAVPQRDVGKDSADS